MFPWSRYRLGYRCLARVVARGRVWGWLVRGGPQKSDAHAGASSRDRRPPAPLVVSADGTAAMQTDVFGPFVAFCNFERGSQLWTGSVLVVASHASSPRPPTLELR